jgi:hypothetical protein
MSLSPNLCQSQVMSQSTVQAKLYAGKNRIGSSIQAQGPGEFMGQRWRSYDLSDKMSLDW